MHLSSKFQSASIINSSTRARQRREYMTPGLLEWLERLEREGRVEWVGPHQCESLATACFLGWIQRRRASDGFLLRGKNQGVMYELSGEGREALIDYREAVRAGL